MKNHVRNGYLCFQIMTALIFMLAAGSPGCNSSESGLDDPCEGIVCDNPPPPECDGDELLTYEQTGVCSEGMCEYQAYRTPCGEDHVCINAQCVPEQTIGETCADIEPCNTPPESECTENIAVNHAEQGECLEFETVAICVYEKHETDCTLENRICETGPDGNTVCVDFVETCEEHGPCNTPPNPHCFEGGIVTYEDIGSCDDTAGYAVCYYESVTAPCESPAETKYCSGDILHIHTSTDCESVGGTPECVHTTIDVDCSGYGRICWADGLGNADCYTDPDDQVCIDPCTSDAQCGRNIDFCVEFLESEGAFCTRSCDNQDDCPPDYNCQEVVSANGKTGHQCIPGGGYCVEPICGLGPPPPPTQDGGNCSHPGCADEPECTFGFNFDFETWSLGEPVGFYLDASADVDVTMDEDSFNSGSRSAIIESRTQNINRDLRAVVSLKNPMVGVQYTFHAWYRFHPAPQNGGYDNDFIRLIMWLRDENGSLHREGHDTGFYWSVATNEIYGMVDEWTEAVVTTPEVEADRVDLRPFFRLRSRRDIATVAWTDDWAITTPYDFTLDSGRLDPSAIKVVKAGDLQINAAVNNKGVLYAATNSAVNDGVRVLYVWLDGPGQGAVSPPLCKTGSTAGPSERGRLLALVQNADATDCGWLHFDPYAGEWIESPGDGNRCACSNTPGGILAGTIDLAVLMDVPAHKVPGRISFASAGYDKRYKGPLIPSTRLPARGQGGDITGAETESIHRSRLLAGKAHN